MKKKIYLFIFSWIIIFSLNICGLQNASNLHELMYAGKDLETKNVKENYNDLFTINEELLNICFVLTNSSNKDKFLDNDLENALFLLGSDYYIKKIKSKRLLFQKISDAFNPHNINKNSIYPDEIEQKSNNINDFIDKNKILNKINNLSPEYISAISKLYDKDFDLIQITRIFENCVKEQSDSSLIPYMFAIYIDKFNDNSTYNIALNKSFDLCSKLRDKKNQMIVYLMIYSRYILKLKIEKDNLIKISEKIDNKNNIDEKSFNTIKSGIAEYNLLLKQSKIVLDKIIFSKDHICDEFNKKTQFLFNVWTDYNNIKERFNNKINSLNNNNNISKEHQRKCACDSVCLLVIIFILFSVILIFIFLH